MPEGSCTFCWAVIQNVQALPEGRRGHPRWQELIPPFIYTVLLRDDDKYVANSSNLNGRSGYRQ